MNNSDYDWFRFWVHFIFGAILGAIVGGAIWMRMWQPVMSDFLIVEVFSLGVAVLGGIYGDRFWESFIKSLRWW